MSEMNLGGLDDQTANEEKVTNFQDAKKNRRPFHIWKVGDTEYKLKLKTDAIETLENKYRQAVFTLVTNDMPPLAVMLTVVYAGLRDWQHGIKFDDMKKIYQKWVDEEGGNLMEFYAKVLMPMMAVSGFFTAKQAEEILSKTEDLDDAL